MKNLLNQSREADKGDEKSEQLTPSLKPHGREGFFMLPGKENSQRQRRRISKNRQREVS